MEEKIKQEPTQEEMIQILSQTVINQDAELNRLRKEKHKLEKEIKEIKEELSKPTQVMEAPEAIERRAIERYLEHEVEYAKAKISELRHHLADYPEDGYSHEDLRNTLLHLNYLKAMMRRLYL